MLIICCTPLQTLIARAMLRAEQVSCFKLIYYTWIDNDKHRHYYDELAALAEKSSFVRFDARFPVHFSRFVRALGVVRADEDDTIAFAAINNVYVQYTVNRFKYKTVLTFDDGTANISRRSVYFSIKRRSVLHELGGLMLRANKNQNWIRRRSARHYTIYPGLENIVAPRRLVPISLFDSTTRLAVVAKPRGVLRIFLGQPLEDANDSAFSAWYRALLDALQIDEYLPHPRESSAHAIRNAVQTQLIAEDYILQKLDEYDLIDVYAISSTALLNIDATRTRRFIVAYPNAPKPLAALYPLFESRGCVLTTLEQLAHHGL